ncbi:hypothetical protein AALP_AA3G200800 [Arabis alpina]|uniref:Uncharacterized protein n=1 Tax=Arabis alpina TaxID=50452 RepID=A0A087HAE6_ARAAL|nr:hypothetical protein AALP_AA3G200800 [Arabis alpina]
MGDARDNEDYDEEDEKIPDLGNKVNGHKVIATIGDGCTSQERSVSPSNSQRILDGRCAVFLKTVQETEKEPSVLEDRAVAARGGMETLRPALHRLYMTRASQYKDALTSFIQGYHEGLQQFMGPSEKIHLWLSKD